MKQLGQTFNEGIGGSKDAFHAPCVLVCSQQQLNPGQHVKFTDKSLANVLATVPGQAHAIVDPFLPGPVDPGDYFWVLALPGTTKNLTHEFEVELEKPKEIQVQVPTPNIGQKIILGGVPFEVHEVVQIPPPPDAWAEAADETDECGSCN